MSYLQILTASPSWYKEWMTLIPEGKIFNLRSVFDGLPQIIAKLPLTIGLTIGGALFGLFLGLIFAIVKINKVPVLYRIQAFFVSFLRGTPILVQLMLTYYGIPLTLKAINLRFGTQLNINDLPAYLFVIIAFAFNEAAYASETLRAAIQSVDPGEIEAARSLGMTQVQVYQRVIIPHAAVVATPTLINNLIGLTKGTSLAFSAGIVEIYAQAQIMGGRDYRYFERFISVAIVYWLVNMLIEQFGRLVEGRMAISTPKAKDVEASFSIQGGDRT